MRCASDLFRENVPLKCTLLILFSSVHFNTHAAVFMNSGLVRYLKIHESLKNRGPFFHTWEVFLKMAFLAKVLKSSGIL